MNVRLATKNNHKVEEYKLLLGQTGWDIEVLPSCISEAPETGETFQENAIQKAQFYASELQEPVLADDSGLRVRALGGEPGVRSARYAGEHGNDSANNRKLVERLHEVGVEDAEAEFVCALALVDADGNILFCDEGVVSGVVTDVAKGTSGFGYDPHFYLPDVGQTMAELSPEEKNMRSHRGLAVQKLLEAAQRGFHIK